MATKPREGVKALVAAPLKKILFAASLREHAKKTCNRISFANLKFRNLEKKEKQNFAKLKSKSQIRSHQILDKKKIHAFSDYIRKCHFYIFIYVQIFPIDSTLNWKCTIVLLRFPNIILFLGSEIPRKLIYFRQISEMA